ncbi:hypothetical protein IP90_00229 [Luteimonas cucumeris]|uniref:Lipoprotein n=1 Tax=Luteimonas cucumeris TaxID=985012 RepID=A0A562LEA3_9GAMM|nr:hypothetical protein [Luteimonas cucumeris]TWI05967.1 hypothetical protein IP90_00229 [Luteimonas cucumeris]
MKYRSLLAVSLLLAAGPALATSCEESFAKKGNPFTGTTYSAWVSLPDLSVKSAIGQMHVVAKEAGMDILSEDADAGSMLIEEPETMAHKPLPMIISAANEGGVGTVTMLLKLNKGAFASGDGVRTEMCKMLAQLKPGTAGDQFAGKQIAVAPTAIAAGKLGFQLENQAKDNLAAIEPRYKDKQFIISGRVNGPVLKSGGTYNMGFELYDGDRYGQVAISCAFAANQAAYALTLKPREKVALSGTFDHFDQIGRVFWLKECRGS